MSEPKELLMPPDQLANRQAWIEALARLEFAVETYTGWDDSSIEDSVRDLRLLLQQQEAEINQLRAQQTPVAVRLPGPKDLSTKLKFCWWWNCMLDSWTFCDASYCDHSIYTHWLPAHALPMPQGEVQ